jgi:hypothetical protein
MTKLGVSGVRCLSSICGLLLSQLACLGSVLPGGDAGLADVVDAGDGGMQGWDAGVSPTDGGAQNWDAGVPPNDGGEENRDAGVLPSDGGSPPSDGGVRSADAGAPPRDAGTVSGTHGQSLVWVWYNYSTVLPLLATRPQTFTHVSPALYQVNYSYASGVPQFQGGSDSFDGLTSAQVVAQVHAAGFKCVPLIYGGASNLGTDQGIQNILNDSPAGAQASFVAALVSEGVSKGYDGWNLDWEVDNNATTYPLYGAKLESFLGTLKAALNAHGMILSIDLGTWFIKQTWCSGGSGVVDLTHLGPLVDQAILEDYASSLGTASDACPASLTNPQTCGVDFISALNLMCAYLPASVVSIGLDASATGNNAIAAETLSTLESYGITQVAMWPDYNTAGPGGSYVFMTTQGISPAGATWFELLSGFLTHYPGG